MSSSGTFFNTLTLSPSHLILNPAQVSTGQPLTHGATDSLIFSVILTILVPFIYRRRTVCSDAQRCRLFFKRWIEVRADSRIGGVFTVYVGQN